MSTQLVLPVFAEPTRQCHMFQAISISPRQMIPKEEMYSTVSSDCRMPSDELLMGVPCVAASSLILFLESLLILVALRLRRSVEALMALQVPTALCHARWME